MYIYLYINLFSTLKIRPTVQFIWYISGLSLVTLFIYKNAGYTVFMYCFSINLTCALGTSPEARRPSRIYVSETIETRTMHDGSLFRAVLSRERTLIREKLVARSPAVGNVAELSSAKSQFPCFRNEGTWPI